MPILEQQPLTLPIPIREEPLGVLRVGRSRVLLELVIRAHQRGASPHEIVRMYDSLELGDVYAVVAYYLAHPTEVDEYLSRCDEEADAMCRKLEREQRPAPSKAELLARARSRGLEPVRLLVDENFNQHIAEGLLARDPGLDSLQQTSAWPRQPIPRSSSRRPRRIESS